MNMNRRDFLAGAAFAAGGTAISGCALSRFSLGGVSGAPMYGFSAPALDRVRIGVIGLGERGWRAVERLSHLPGVEIAAICDNVPEKFARTRESLKKRGLPAAREFGGEEGWKALCDYDGIDVVYSATPWYLHAKTGVRAMKAGKHVMIEVPAAMYIDECWELVETSEATRRHCMQLENCIYGEAEMLSYNLCRAKMFGDLLYGECGYLHDRRKGVFSDIYTDHWRMWWNVHHRGDQYPTHGLGPICRCMDINCGDRLDYLVSVDTKQAGYETYAKENFPGTWKADLKFETGDATFTTVRTALGRVIVIKHDTTSPRPYSRINRIQGTKGVFEGSCPVDGKKTGWPMRIALEDVKNGKSAHGWMEDEAAEEMRRAYMHPLWKAAGELAVKVGGHGGMDFLMDLSWTHCLRKGLPLDMSVYDLASWCSVCEVSERSVRAGSAPRSIPDFTRGAWKNAPRRDIVTITPGDLV